MADSVPLEAPFVLSPCIFETLMPLTLKMAELLATLDVVYTFTSIGLLVRL
jgi:hypothetical protein